MTDRTDDAIAPPTSDRPPEAARSESPPQDPPGADAAFRRSTPPTSPLLVPPQPTPSKASSNVLGIVAFGLSLVGFGIPVVPSIAGLVCGILALRREPRGFAIAAIVISVLSGCIGLFIVVSVVLPLLALTGIMTGGPFLPPMGPVMDNAVAQSLSAEVDLFRRERGRLPNDLQELPSGPAVLASHVNPLRIEFGTFTRVEPSDPISPGPIEVDYRIVSAGEDRVFGTADDVVVLGLPPAVDGPWTEDGAPTEEPPPP